MSSMGIGAPRRLSTPQTANASFDRSIVLTQAMHTPGSLRKRQSLGSIDRPRSRKLTYPFASPFFPPFVNPFTWKPEWFLPVKTRIPSPATSSIQSWLCIGSVKGRLWVERTITSLVVFGQSAKATGRCARRSLGFLLTVLDLLLLRFCFL